MADRGTLAGSSTGASAGDSRTLIADRGLAGMPLVKLCTARGWHYLLRARAEHTCRRFFHGKLERGWKR